jgi:hypothetical protein
MSKRTSYGKIHRPDVRMCPHLPRVRDFPQERFLPSAAIKINLRGPSAFARTRVASEQMRLCVRMNASCIRTDALPPSLPPLPSPASSPPSCPVQTQDAVRADGLCSRPRGCSKKKNLKFKKKFNFFW